MKQILLGMAVLAAMTIAFAPAAVALEPTVVTFDNGMEGWSANPDCETINADGGNSGAYLNIQPNGCDNNWFTKSRFKIETETNPAFIGDYTAKGPVRLSFDVDSNFWDFWWNEPIGSGFPLEEYLRVVVEFIDHDNPWTDPDTGHAWPWTSVIYVADYLPHRDDGWKTIEIDIEDPNATELPEGWVGFGGPEVDWLPALPPNRTFADVLAGIDEIQIHTWEPGMFYPQQYLYDLNFDNITIKELPQECQGYEATVYVGYDGIVHGGQFDGQPYNGRLTGTHGDDVIVGTDGQDDIQGLHGNDLICAGAGNDKVHGGQGEDVMFGEEGDDHLLGQQGMDFLHGGPGEDMVNGGPGSDTCIEATSFKLCGEY